MYYANKVFLMRIFHKCCWLIQFWGILKSTWVRSLKTCVKKTSCKISFIFHWIFVLPEAALRTKEDLLHAASEVNNDVDVVYLGDGAGRWGVCPLLLPLTWGFCVLLGNEFKSLQYHPECPVSVLNSQRFPGVIWKVEFFSIHFWAFPWII